jgi:hypothetical protein
MDRLKPSTRIEPLPPKHSTKLKEQFEAMRKNVGFIPNSILIDAGAAASGPERSDR